MRVGIVPVLFSVVFTAIGKVPDILEALIKYSSK